MLKFTKHSGVYSLEVAQDFPIKQEEAWAFLSDPANLEKITPPHMKFTITSKVDAKMYAGQLITYKVAIMSGFKTNWVTEITHVNAPFYFVDEQRFGPYSMWHHEHRIIQEKDGIRMLDKVTYKIPLGILGNLAHALFIKKQLREIFNYRFQALSNMFCTDSLKNTAELS